MDNVTQQNAANAEESASAAEEMSVQAEKMKGVVSELMSLMGDAPKIVKNPQIISQKNVDISVNREKAAEYLPSKKDSSIYPSVKTAPSKEVSLDDDFCEF